MSEVECECGWKGSADSLDQYMPSGENKTYFLCPRCGTKQWEDDNTELADESPEDLLDVCLTRGFLDNFLVDKCSKCGRGDRLTFTDLQALLSYYEDGIPHYGDEE